jgi:drug/metabolite transporter (DMT)-like permease
MLEQLPDSFVGKLAFLMKWLFDPYIFSSFFAAFLASLTWMASLKEFELSKAYPYMSLSFIAVILLSVVFFKETLSIQKIIGSALIIAGLIILSKAA